MDVLIPLLDRDEVNYKVAWALGEIGDMRAIPELIVALSNKDPLVRYTSIGALESLRAIQALPYLTALFTDPAVPVPGDRVLSGFLGKGRLRTPSDEVGYLWAISWVILQRSCCFTVHWPHRWSCCGCSDEHLRITGRLASYCFL